MDRTTDRLARALSSMRASSLPDPDPRLADRIEAEIRRAWSEVFPAN